MTEILEFHPITRNMTWANAMVWAESIGEGWRMPTVQELFALIDLETGKIQDGFKLNSYWTSTSHWSSDKFARYVCFDDGAVGYSIKTITMYVRLVRNKI